MFTEGRAFFITSQAHRLWTQPTKPSIASKRKRAQPQDGLCRASQSACDKLVEVFNALNERLRKSVRDKK
jgi:hypothetical protein